MNHRVLVVLLSLALLGCAQSADGGGAGGDGAPAGPRAAPAETDVTDGMAECPEGETPCNDVGGDAGPGSELPPVAGMCAEDAPDCVDTIDPGDLPVDGDGPAAGTCLEGATECADNPGVAPPGPPDGATAMPVEPRDGLVDPSPVPWVEVVPVDDAQTMLQVSWWSGNQACHGLDSIEVDEAEEVVTITVVAGRDPDNEICTEEALLVSSTVELSDVLGPRSIVDGATG